MRIKTARGCRWGCRGCRRRWSQAHVSGGGRSWSHGRRYLDSHAAVRLVTPGRTCGRGTSARRKDSRSPHMYVPTPTNVTPAHSTTTPPPHSKNCSECCFPIPRTAFWHHPTMKRPRIERRVIDVVETEVVQTHLLETVFRGNT